MKNNAKSAFLILISIIQFTSSCSKSDPANPSTNNADSAKLILLSTREYDANAFLNTCLSCFNPNKTLRWKRTQLGNAGRPDPIYSNGILYYSVSYFAFTTGNNYNAYSNFYAIDPNTGIDIWKIVNSPNYIDNHTVRNDSIFCAMHETNVPGNPQGVNNIAVYNARNGALIWKQVIADYYGPTNLKLDGNMVYFLTAPSINNTSIYINAFDLVSKTIKWKVSIGINLANRASYISIANDVLLIKSGTGSLLAFNKTTGASIWSKNGPDFNTPVLVNNVVYALGANQNLFYINPVNGNILSQFPWGNNTATLIGGQPFVMDNTVYTLGQGATSVLSSYNSVTGIRNWEKTIPVSCQSHVGLGNNLYALKMKLFNNNSPTDKIMIIDRATGILKDSIAIAAEEFGNIGIISGLGNYITPN
jgi:hypothetical protein